MADERERASGIPEELKSLGPRVEYRVLDVADYLTGDYSVERKSVRDFIGSVFDGRLFDQAYRLSKSYDNVLLIVEGDISQRLEELKNQRWFWGGVAYGVLDYEMKCCVTPDSTQISKLIYSICIT